MFSKTRASLLSLTVIAVLIFSAIGPTIVYADDSQPPDTTAPQTIDNNNDSDKADTAKCDSNKEGKNKDKKGKKNKSGHKDSNICSSDGAAPDTTGGNDSNEEAAAPQPAEAASVDANLLAAVPDNTSVTVLNAEGQAEPLATQAAADAIASTTDPIWCPQGQPPIPGANNCTPSFPSFTLLLTFLAANTTTYQGAGTIYVEQGTYGGGESVIDFNAYNLSNISSSDLTVQGGWDTTANPVDPTTASTSNFTVPILIGSSTNPWGGSLTINNIVITGAQSGLTLSSQNNITLAYVQVTDSVTGAGAELDAGANVTINNSKFLRNNTAGAIVNAGANVAVANSEFSNTFNQRRQIKGLGITSGGSVSLFQVLAIGNRRVGTDISAVGRVTIGSSQFSETNGNNGGVFYGYGLRVVTPDEIELLGVTANNNFLWGADLDAGGRIAIGDSVFNANSTSSPTFIDDTGLLVTSGSNVDLSNVTADGNRLIGATIDAVGAVNIFNSSFSNNRGVTTIGTTTTYHGLGLSVVSSSNVSLNAVTASGNGLTGAYLNSGGEVLVKDSSISNNDTGPAGPLLGTGLTVISTGNSSIANTTLDNNQTYGAAIQAGGHTFLDLVTATNNGTDGMQVEAMCTHLNGGMYSGNGQYGLNLVNSPLDLVVMPTFGSNGAGDIFPATPATCPPLFPFFTGANPGTVTNQGASSNTSSLQQAVSYNLLTGAGANPSLGASLNSLVYGITREVTSSGFVTSIFAGQYIYVYTIYNADVEPSLDNLQIILVTPAPLTGIAMVRP